jgi:hypothetical protein
MRALPPPRVILTAVPAFERRASAHFLRRPRTEKIATSAITRLYAEKTVQRNGSVRYGRRSSRESRAHPLNSDLRAVLFFNCNARGPCEIFPSTPARLRLFDCRTPRAHQGWTCDKPGSVKIGRSALIRGFDEQVRPRACRYLVAASRRLSHRSRPVGRTEI